MPEFRAPVGTRDVVPPESARWVQLVATFADLVGRAGYGLVVSPMFEDVGVFERLGASTDVVRKEMYDFRDKSDRHLALRPDGTASVVRAYLEQRPPTPWKTWYVAPSFRYERPQAGRYRQHHQLGIEVVGTDDPDVDVEVIGLLDTLYRAVGLQQRTLFLNSLGDAASRPAYLARAARPPPSPRLHTLRAESGDDGGQPVAGARLEAAGRCRRDRDGPRDGRLPLGGVGSALRAESSAGCSHSGSIS